jgi:MinD-like ATPase involved in chromosome partitioning or flagellar assembly
VVSAEVQPSAPPSLKDKLKKRLEESAAVVVEAEQPNPAQALQDAAQELAGEPVDITIQEVDSHEEKVNKPLQEPPVTV